MDEHLAEFIASSAIMTYANWRLSTELRLFRMHVQGWMDGRINCALDICLNLLFRMLNVKLPWSLIYV